MVGNGGDAGLSISEMEEKLADARAQADAISSKRKMFSFKRKKNTRSGKQKSPYLYWGFSFVPPAVLRSSGPRATYPRPFLCWLWLMLRHALPASACAPSRFSKAVHLSYHGLVTATLRTLPASASASTNSAP